MSTMSWCLSSERLAEHVGPLQRKEVWNQGDESQENSGLRIGRAEGLSGQDRGLQQSPAAVVQT